MSDMTARQPRDSQLHCDDCGFTTPVTTPNHAARSLKLHSCDNERERQARRQRRLDRLAASGEERPCLHDGKHPHGDRVRYVIDKCRCRPCRDAASAYQRGLERRHLYGKTIYVDAAPARAHVRALQTQGMGWKRIAHAAQVQPSVMWKLLYGDRTRNLAPSKRIRPTTEEKILGVRLDLAAGLPVDGTGTGRRLQALCFLGWSVGQISAQSGLDRQALDKAIHGGAISVKTRDAVRATYDRLWNQPPPETNKRERIAASRSRRRALIAGWAPPLAWDDEAIDDPAATPELGQSRATNRGRALEDLVEDVEFLLDDEPLSTAEQLARRLGYADRSGLQLALKRAGRQDLLDQLSRNARLHQEGTAA
ncbi:MAG: hypothetical protein HOV78_20420 [Hamadaea sp.]|nr:hypothetical protein [Hamadaea sp.]NUO90647.1 hypothetical protein [Dermatophilaceae bacterium]